MRQGTEFALRWLRRLAQLGVLGFGVAVVFGWFGWLHPAFDSFATFRMFFGAGLAAALVVLLLFRRWAWVAAGVAMLLISAALTFPHLPGMKRGWAVEGAAPLKGKPRLRVAQANLLLSIREHAETIAILRSADPDVILLQELRRDDRTTLRELAKTHPHQLDCTEGRWHSVAIVSRLPLATNATDFCPAPGGLGISQIMLEGTPVNVVSYHAWWPWPNNQHYQRARLTKVLSGLQGATIMGGDFNNSPWSHAVRDFARSFGGQVPAGLWLTWQPQPLKWWLPAIRVLPLDHTLHSPDFGLISRELLPSGGSDHHPVVSEYVFLD
ncbi:MAG: endonuclease/exonuclease/phosphatase family protein [Pseudomonadota bacterium]